MDKYRSPEMQAYLLKVAVDQYRHEHELKGRLDLQFPLPFSLIPLLAGVTGFLFQRTFEFKGTLSTMLGVPILFWSLFLATLLLVLAMLYLWEGYRSKEYGFIPLPGKIVEYADQLETFRQTNQKYVAGGQTDYFVLKELDSKMLSWLSKATDINARSNSHILAALNRAKTFILLSALVVLVSMASYLWISYQSQNALTNGSEGKVATIKTQESRND